MLAVALMAILAAIFAWFTKSFVLMALFWPVIGYVMFEFVLSFHDASHGRLHPVPWLNELLGHALGSMALVPLDVYRFAHSRHHAYLGSERDPELWPFTIPGTPRHLRILAALLEIVCGVLYVPLLFLRAVIVYETSPRERRRILVGYLILGITWAVNLAMIHAFNFWQLFLAVVVVPLTIAGMLQTLNKFMQHLGLHGRTVLGMTRTVVDADWSSRMISKSLLYNDYHGTHHRYAKIPYYNLPAATPYTLSMAEEPCPVFPNVASALFNMLPCLANPKVGPQWVELRNKTYVEMESDESVHGQRSDLI